MTPIRARDPFDWAAVLGLIRTAFADMEGRIDPPSSIQHLTSADIAKQAQTGEVWVIGQQPPLATIFLTLQADALYLGKLAVAPMHRHKGLARHLVLLAETRARALGKPCLRLQTRIELTENHTAFSALGFHKTAETCHQGFDRATSITMEKPLPVPIQG